MCRGEISSDQNSKERRGESKQLIIIEHGLDDAAGYISNPHTITRVTNHPANTKTTAELLAIAQGRNLSMTDLIGMPEQDSWTYPLDDASCGRAAGCDGPAMVCNVFVCRMWKVRGNSLFSARRFLGGRPLRRGLQLRRADAPGYVGSGVVPRRAS